MGNQRIYQLGEKQVQNQGAVIISVETRVFDRLKKMVR